MFAATLLTIAGAVGSPEPAALAFPTRLVPSRSPGSGDDPREYELEILKPVFDKYYQAGSDYYKNGWRNEALWCLDRAAKILPEFGGLERFTTLLRDFDNPVWRKKRWKSPRAAVDAGFRSRQDAYDLDYAEALLRIGTKHGRKSDDAALTERARRSFRDALEIVGGPYELDGSGRIVAGKAGTVPESFSKRMLEEDLVLINGKRWLRDSMLRAIQDVSAVQEARSARCLVRTLSTAEEANRLLALIEQAYPAFVKELGERRANRLLGLFVFADRAGYETWCKASGNEAQIRAAGFAQSLEGFAVLFAQPGVDAVAIHEAAHLYHFDVYASAMPSWYSEGVAETFGGRHAMRVQDGKLATALRPTKASLAPLLRDGKLVLPLDDLLRGDAGKLIAANDGTASTFYLASWALYSFLTTTKESRLSGRFDDWESFALGSRFADAGKGGSGGERDDATKLFDRLFADVKGVLEDEFTSWIADPK